MKPKVRIKMKTQNAKPSKKVVIAKKGIYWVIRGLKHGSGKERLFSTDFRALECAKALWPGCDCVYEGK